MCVLLWKSIEDVLIMLPFLPFDISGKKSSADRGPWRNCDRYANFPLLWKKRLCLPVCLVHSLSSSPSLPITLPLSVFLSLLLPLSPSLSLSHPVPLAPSLPITLPLSVFLSLLLLLSPSLSLFLSLLLSVSPSLSPSLSSFHIPLALELKAADRKTCKFNLFAKIAETKYA